MTKIVIAGASGKMGRSLIEATLAADPDYLLGATARPSSTLIGVDAGELVGYGHHSAPIANSLSEFLPKSPVIIDFTAIDATLLHLQDCIKHQCPIVIGTTGFSEADEALIHDASTQIPIVYAPNFSVGVNLVLDLLDRTARILGDSVDVEVLEAHHRNKVDAPSGTALAMGRVVAAALKRDFSKVAVYGREGQEGARPREQIGFATVRAGDIVGEHTVLFASEGERIEITHKASNRRTFADGAIRAAVWLGKKSPGLYGMRDVLDL
jgi:4-hydroxy-tetrahydrodipicolinate reductase|tara:strand:- start:3547 stop:4347 length:801 start_codon:yes stop_codon:yes gene_type:complete